MRTDRTHLCGYCAVRFSPAARCPECGRERVYDLTIARKRRNGLRMVRRYRGSRGAQRARRVGDVYFVKVVPLLALIVGVVTWSVAAGAAALFASWLVGALVARLAARARDGDGPVVPFIRLLPAPAPDPRVERRSARGTVRVIEPVIAPISGRSCAAYRVVGEGPTGLIDEAGVGRFAIEGDPQGAARVDTSSATVDLPVAEPTLTMPPCKPFRSGDRVYRFLRNHGLCPHLGASRLAEVVLAEGDAVEVIGSADDVAAPVGYRDVGYERVFRERDGSPLVVRAAPPA